MVKVEFYVRIYVKTNDENCMNLMHVRNYCESRAERSVELYRMEIGTHSIGPLRNHNRRISNVCGYLHNVPRFFTCESCLSYDACFKNWAMLRAIVESLMVFVTVSTDMNAFKENVLFSEDQLFHHWDSVLPFDLMLNGLTV